ncbi:MAG TPA: ABC transporter permease [Terriglobales bacterium]|nr:ABC transporter permease [Terriglobales bacterium]
MGAFGQDLRYGARLLRQAPGFAVIAILTLALGIGANTALFSVVNGILLNPLPFARPSQLVSLYTSTPNFKHGSVSYPNFLDWKRLNHTFSGMAAYRGDSYDLTGAGRPEHARAEMISAGFFHLLGVPIAVGREFTSSEDQPGARPVVMLSEGFWRRKFGGSGAVIGRSVVLDNVSYTIVGIVPSRFDRSFTFGSRDVYIPIGQWNDPTFRQRSVSMGTRVVGRLQPGVSAEQAQADLDTVARQLATAYPSDDQRSGVNLVPLKDDIVGGVRTLLLTLLGAVGFVLLIACANVANLVLARATGRGREFALRSALGAGRARIMRQLLTESVLLALAGGLLGGAVAWWGTTSAVSALPAALPRPAALRPDWHVLLFTLILALVTAVLFGLAPALKTARGELHASLKEGGRGASGARHRAEGLFVAAEMALAVVLLIGAGLMLRSLSALWKVDPGFNPRHLLTFAMSVPPHLAANPAAARAFLREISRRVEAVPGIQAASVLGGSLPLSGSDSELPFWRAGQPKPASMQAMPFALFYLVQPDFPKTFGLRLLRGRFLSGQDDEHAPMAVVVDEDFARKYFANQDPIGQLINLDILGTQAQIVGIVGHVKHWDLDSRHVPVQAEMYLSLAQLPDRFTPLLVRGGVLVLARTSGNPEAVIPAIRRTAAGLDPNGVVYDIAAMPQIIDSSLSDRRFAMDLLGVFAVLALVLAGIGIYGVIAYVTGQRTHEIGIRMALGARPGDVLAMVLRQGGQMALAGVIAGLIAAALLTRWLSSMLFGVGARDPATYVLVAIALTLVALAACLAPAWRAARVAPVLALRAE